MPSARIDLNQVRLLVEKQIGTVRAYRQFANTQANRIFETAKDRMLEQFDDDPITQELEAGPEEVGSSLLPGGYGNLFSFIGFYDDEKPIEELRAYLEASIRLVQTPQTKPLEYIFRVTIPTQDEIASVTPMPFGTASSWALGVEKGIPGFNRYLFDLEREFAASRSGPAVQTDEKHVLRNSEFTPKPYLFKKIFPAFAKSLLSS